MKNPMRPGGVWGSFCLQPFTPHNKEKTRV